MSWGYPVALSIAATPGTAWVVARDALRLFVDGAVLVEWSDAQGFANNTVIARCETRVLPAVLKPICAVKTTVVGP